MRGPGRGAAPGARGRLGSAPGPRMRQAGPPRWPGRAQVRAARTPRAPPGSSAVPGPLGGERGAVLPEGVGPGAAGKGPGVPTPCGPVGWGEACAVRTPERRGVVR